jgi:hypothetical protein
MTRNMAFSHTTKQLIEGKKDVTRRMGWTNLKPGEVVCAVVKSQGLKKGERVERIGLIEIVSVRRENLRLITRGEIDREGFPEMEWLEFIQLFCKVNKCHYFDVITRIEFKRLF